MRLIIIILLLFGITWTAASQIITISGKVVDKATGEPIDRALVSVKRTENNRIVAFMQTAGDGIFEIKKAFDPTGCSLEVSCMGYAPQTKDIPADGKPLLFEMNEKDIKLKEVVVNAPKIGQKGDTVRYRVSAFSIESDRTIGDVLKKMPGIEVEESGKIKYQGQEINKFYVEGSDLLGGRYGLATNNISHKDVASVEVMENHQPVKALEDIVVSTQSAINIKLKEDAKTRWAGTLKVGGGIPSLWNIEAFAMRFKKKVQSMNTYKGNNLGGAYNETRLFLPDGDFGSWEQSNNTPTYIHVSPSLAKNIGSNRSRFETKHHLTSNNLVKVGNGYDLLPEFILSHSRQESEYKALTTYLLDGENVSVEEKNETTRANEKSIDGKIQLKGNKERFYLNNSLNLNLHWNETDMIIAGTYPNRQAADITYRKISNDFSLLKRIGRKTISLQSVNEYTMKPQSLTVTKDNEAPVQQDIDMAAFSSNSSVKYGFAVSRFYFDLSGEISYRNRTIDNTLDNEASHSRTETFKTTVNTSVQYKRDLLSVRFNAPVFYQHLSVAGASKSIPGVNPRLSLNLIVSPKTSFSLSGSYRMELPDESLFYTGNIMNNYRLLNAGYINFDTGDSYNASAGIKYKDVLNLFFADVTMVASNTKSKKISNQMFVDDFILTGYMPAHINNQNILVSGSVSKGFDWLNGLIALYPMWSAGKRVLMRNDTRLPYNNRLYALRGKINTKIVHWSHLDYNFSFAYSTYKIENQESSSYDRFSQSLTAHFFILKPLQLKYTLEHYRDEPDDGNYKNFVFSDITLSYLLGTRWEFSCFIKNIFNQKRYSYFTENELVSHKQDYKIRGRELLINASYRF